MTFGEKIKKIRTDNNMTQDELAEKLFVTRTAISKWETGKGYPSVDSLKLFSDLFGISIDDLLSDEDVENKKILDKARSRKFYWLAVVILILTVIISLISYFCQIPALRFVSIAGMIAYTLCAISAKPKYKRIESKKYITTYVVSRLIFLTIVIVIMVDTIISMK